MYAIIVLQLIKLFVQLSSESAVILIPNFNLVKLFLTYFYFIFHLAHFYTNQASPFDALSASAMRRTASFLPHYLAGG